MCATSKNNLDCWGTQYKSLANKGTCVCMCTIIKVLVTNKYVPQKNSSMPSRFFLSTICTDGVINSYESAYFFGGMKRAWKPFYDIVKTFETYSRSHDCNIENSFEA